MFSLPDIAVISVLALLLFGPDRLPTMMRQAGRFMREVQNTSASFVSEMERAADVEEKIPYVPPEPEPAPAAETLPTAETLPAAETSPAAETLPPAESLPLTETPPAEPRPPSVLPGDAKV
jgi:TatA/E family protein of Tat protein translocase